MRYASDTLAQHPFSSTAVRSMRSTLPAALPEPLLRASLSSQILPGDARTCVSSVWGQP